MSLAIQTQVISELEVTDGKAVSGLISDNNFTIYDKTVP